MIKKITNMIWNVLMVSYTIIGLAFIFPFALVFAMAELSYDSINKRFKR